MDVYGAEKEVTPLFPMSPRDNIGIFCIGWDRSIDDAVRCIDHNTKGIALVVDTDRKLVGTITDGDVRRWILRGLSLDRPILEMLGTKKSLHPKPVTARSGTDHATLLKLMQDLLVRQVPLLDDEERVLDLATLDDLLPNQSLPVQAVIMAGGFGTRLMPLTENLPKPMLPVGDRPLMESIIDQLRRAGIHRVNVTTHYERDKIKSYFGDGENFGVGLHYVDEDEPLGTAGALSLMASPTEPLLVINGDIQTQVDFRAMLQFHREHEVDMTVAVRKYAVDVPYGVVECEGVLVKGLQEKPQLSFFVNAGIYLLEPSVHAVIPNGRNFHMTELIQRLIAAGRPVASFPVREHWLDIGRHADYAAAQEFAKSEKTPS